MFRALGDISMSRRRRMQSHPDQEGGPIPTESPKATTRPGCTIIMAMIVQALCVLPVACLPFGFDHPSEWGLAYGHFLCFHFVYFIAVIVGVIAAAWQRRPILLGIQLAGLLVGALTYLVLISG